jgi:hypothetical protein
MSLNAWKPFGYVDNESIAFLQAFESDVSDVSSDDDWTYSDSSASVQGPNVIFTIHEKLDSWSTSVMIPLLNQCTKNRTSCSTTKLRLSWAMMRSVVFVCNVPRTLFWRHVVTNVFALFVWISCKASRLPEVSETSVPFVVRNSILVLKCMSSLLYCCCSTVCVFWSVVAACCSCIICCLLNCLLNC